MNFRNRQTWALFFLTCGFFLSCNKSKIKTPQQPEPVTTEMANGLPSDPRKINGYFYASCRSTFNYSGGSAANRSSIQFAGFGDPVRDLLVNYNHENDQKKFGSGNNLENVNVGSVSFNGLFLSGSSGGSYQNFESSSMSPNNYLTRWVTTGNKSFVALNLSVPRGFPKITEPSSPNATATYTINKSSDFSIDLNGLVSNYDSVSVMFGNTFNGSNYYNKIKKTVGPGVNSITFFKSEFSDLPLTDYAGITIMAYNYSNKIERNKIYVFELSNKLDQILAIQN